MQRIYNAECQKFPRESHGVITRYNVCQLVCKVYNNSAAFQKTGIHPLKSNVISPENLRPSEVFVGEPESDEMEERDVEKESNEERIDPKLLFKEKEEKPKEVKSAGSKKRKTMSAIVSGRCITEDRC